MNIFAFTGFLFICSLYKEQIEDNTYELAKRVVEFGGGGGAMDLESKGEYGDALNAELNPQLDPNLENVKIGYFKVKLGYER